MPAEDKTCHPLAEVARGSAQGRREKIYQSLITYKVKIKQLVYKYLITQNNSQ
jgi:hypothetical protein